MTCTDVRDRLLAFAKKLNIHTTEISRVQWASLPLPPEYRFGWMPPVNLHDPVRPDQLILMFSPELLDAVLAGLPVEHAEVYLNAAEHVIAHHVANRDLPVEQANKLLDDVLLSAAPRALAVRTEVELRALDAGIVPIL